MNKINPYINLAKRAVESYIEDGEVIEVPKDLPREMLTRRAGTFVSIFRSTRETTQNPAESGTQNHAKKVLRGCIGTYLPTRKNIAEEIIHNAIAAATEDYRFGPIKREELQYLSYSVYILNKPEQVNDLSELNPKKYGIIIKTARFPLKSALLLPDLEGIDTIEKQISVACQKGGINPQAEKIIIYKFSAKKYDE